MGNTSRPGCRVFRDHQACFVNWFCSYYLHISTKRNDFNRFYIFLKDLRIFDRSKFFLVTRFSVTSLLVTRYFVTLFSNTPAKCSNQLNDLFSQQRRCKVFTNNKRKIYFLKAIPIKRFVSHRLACDGGSQKNNKNNNEHFKGYGFQKRAS